MTILDLSFKWHVGENYMVTALYRVENELPQVLSMGSMEEVSKLCNDVLAASWYRILDILGFVC